MTSRPLPLSQANFSKVRAVFTDVDGTLTTRGQLHSSTVRAIEWLNAHDVKVVLVSGRPSGWGECWARQLPVAGVVVENGGLYFVRDAKGRVHRVYSQAPGIRARNRAKLVEVVQQALKHVGGAQLSSDSVATEVDLAIDYAEDVSLGPDAAHLLETFLRERGVSAVRSSVHVNCWFGSFDKRSAVELFLKREWQTALRPRDLRWVYVGDSFNDAPLFDAFPLSVGVANVLDVLAQLDAPPKFVTRAREGKGFAEIADAIGKARR